MTPPIGLYVHIPFCKVKCHYCDFASGKGTVAEIDRYLGLLEQEARREAPGRVCDTVFVGGGTPSVLNAGQLSRLFGDVIGRFELAPGAEISLEANPESLDRAKARQLALLGVNRVSMGAQSFHDGELARLGRLHDSAQVVRAVHALRSVGIDNINLDLICGFPGNTPETFAASLEKLCELAPPHASVYMFQLEEDSRWGREGREPPEEELQVELYYLAKDRLESAGYVHYEISNFARGARSCRHNLKYWLSHPYLGIGLSAASYTDGVRRVNPRAHEGYREAVERGPAIEQALGPEERAREELVMRLRLLDRASSLETLDPSSRQDVAAVLERYRHLGLLEASPGGYVLSRRGLTLSNEVFAELI